jgi:hypothetical protein
VQQLTLHDEHTQSDILFRQLFCLPFYIRWQGIAPAKCKNSAKVNSAGFPGELDHKAISFFGNKPCPEAYLLARLILFSFLKPVHASI